MDNLNAITDGIRAAFVAKNGARDEAINRSRELIRHCAEGIRAIHRREWEKAAEKLERARSGAEELRNGISEYPDLYAAGYTQDALKEVVEAHCTHAIVRGLALPTPDALTVENDTYLNGLAEAATELRRFILDILRREDADTNEAERLLGAMDDIYDQLVTFDFPDAITGGLRRQTDIVRGVLERTRGDLTTTLQQQRLQAALRRAENLIDP
ncbi:MAG: haloacid dehalogenase [Anaerolineae bacterium]|nr:haloacid dehalogenase [Anaerolineae bacterium]MBN8618834.1 haloacid dehalogenase [Anaerolineae bacterium]